MSFFRTTFFSFLFLANTTAFSQGDSCVNSTFFCTDSFYTYPSLVGTTAEVGPDYNCLGSQPNINWLHFQISQPGNLELTISQVGSGGSGADVDFITYGPYNEPVGPCTLGLNAASVVDCSYSTATTEICTIPGAQVGEYYLLAVTNYSGISGTVTINRTGGTAYAACAGVNGCYGAFSNVLVSSCDTTNNSYSVTGNYLSFNPPLTGNLYLTNSLGDTVGSYTAPFLDTIPFQYSANSDGGAVSITSSFTDSLQCMSYYNYNAPSACICNNFSYLSSVTATCDSICDGTMTVTPTGGILPYSYNWLGMPFETTSYADSLCMGIYSVSISDSVGCVLTATDTVQGFISFNNLVVSGCNIADNLYTISGNILVANPPLTGSLIIYTSLGDSIILTSPFSGTTSFQITGNSMGYSGEISAYFTDNSSCVATSPIITPTVCNCNAPAYNFNIIASGGGSCVSPCNGIATVFSDGGTPPYSIQWNDSSLQTTDTALNLCMGNYSVSVTDSNGCSLSQIIQITNLQNTQNYDISSTQNILLGDSVQLCVFDTANTIVSYLWETGEQTSCINVSPTDTTNYSVSIDFCGGTVQDSVTVIVDIPQGIDYHSSEKEIVISPNPAKNQIKVTGLKEVVDYQIIDINGKIVQKGKTNENISFDLSKGVYIIEFKGYKSKKLIVRI